MTALVLGFASIIVAGFLFIATPLVPTAPTLARRVLLVGIILIIAGAALAARPAATVSADVHAAQ